MQEAAAELAANPGLGVEHEQSNLLERSVDLETVVAIASIASSVTSVASFVYQWYKDWSEGKNDKQLDKVIVEVDGKRYLLRNLSIDQIADLLKRLDN